MRSRWFFQSLLGNERRAFCQQPRQFGFGFGADASGKSMDALPVLGPEHGQAYLQVGLVFFQAAQQALRFRDSFFQRDHEFD